MQDHSYISTDETGDEMARQKRTDIDRTRIDEMARKLSAARTDRSSFEATYAELATDKRLSVEEIVAIALAYRNGGGKPTSKRSALEAIRKRFLELVRGQAQIAQASKARPW